MTLKAISARMKSVKNIRKITRSMKMVSASKYARAERELQQARGIGNAASQFYKIAQIEAAETVPQKLFIAITSDKGLCGGVHSSVCRATRKKVESNKPNVKVVAVGEKARGLLHRYIPEFLLLTANEIGRKIPTFLDASKLTCAILNSQYKYSSGEVIFNKSTNIVSYSTAFFSMFSESTIMLAPKVNFYDIEDSALMQSYMEFSLVCLIYYAIKENNVSEHAARMTAMTAASANAGEMLEKLTIKFNRNRQAAITRELTEIISGASVVTQ